MRDCLVLGSGRSGTSMVAGALAKAGYFMGDRLYPARDSNPLGFFEDPEINGINEELLAPLVRAEQRLGLGQRWLARLDHGVEAPPSSGLRRRMQALVARAPFCFKDPRFCYTLPAWRSDLADTRFVCVFRDPSVTVASLVKECASSNYLRGVAMDAERALGIWCAMYRQVLQRNKSEGRADEWLFVHYDQMLTSDGCARLGLFLDANVDAAFPTAQLRRSKATAPASAEASELYAELCDRAGFEGISRADRPRASRTPLEETTRAHRDAGSERGAPELSVLICTYNRKATLLECLESFSNQTLAPERYELVVVVDGSGDGSSQAVREFRSRAPIRLIDRESNAGLASARSAAVAAARGETILLVNDDTIAFPDLLERHLDVHRRRAPNPIAVLGTFEQPREQLKTALMRALERSHHVFAYHGLRADVDHDWMQFWGCNVSAPRREVVEAGAFDSIFHHYGCEDTDLGIRLHQRGLPVIYEPAARAWHRHVLTFDDLLRRQRTVSRAYVRLFAKHPETICNSSFGRLEKATLEELVAVAAKNEKPLAQLVPLIRQLAELDCAALEAVGGPLTLVAEKVVDGLVQLLQKVDPCWWCEGYMEGLRELGVTSFRELRAWRSDAPPWPLASSTPFKVLAWPVWDDEAELETMLRLASDPRIGAPLCLCLRHDAEHDGDVELAKRRLARVAERGVAGGRDLEVLIVGEPIEPQDRPRLGKAVTCALLLPSSLKGERGRFFVRARAPGVRGVEDLLAFVPPMRGPRVATPELCAVGA